MKAAGRSTPRVAAVTRPDAPGPSTPDTRDPGPVWLPLLVVGLTFVPRLLGLGWGLPDVNEEATPLRQAWEMWPAGPGHPLDLNPHFFNYPSLTFYLHFVLQALLYGLLRLAGQVHSWLDFQVRYFTDPSAFVLAARALQVTLGAGTTWLVYRIGARIGGRAMALPAALLLALNPFYAVRSLMVEVDVPLTFFVTLALYYTLRLLDDPRRADYHKAGLAVGLAASAKYTGALLLPALVVAHLVARSRGGSSAPRAGAGRVSWLFLGESVALAGLAFMLTSPFCLLDFRMAWANLGAEREHMRLGHFGLGELSAWRYYARLATARLLGWPWALAAVGGLVGAAAVARRPWAWVLGTVMVCLGAVLLSWRMMADRYALPLLPGAALAAGWLVAELDRRCGVRAWPAPARGLAVGAATLVLLAGPLTDLKSLTDLFRPSARTAARRWIEAHVAPGSLIVSEPNGPDLLDAIRLRGMPAALRDRVVSSTQSNRVYAVQTLPMYQVRPEQSAPFYDAGLYEAADIVVTASTVRRRYQQEPDRFPRQAAFYDALDQHMEKAWEFAPDASDTPIVTIYRNPRQTVPFARRPTVLAPRPVPRPDARETMGESYFYYNWGVNLETFGQGDAALAAYRLALDCSIWQPGLYGNVVLGVARCLRASGQGAEIGRLIGRWESEAPSAMDRRLIEQLRR